MHRHHLEPQEGTWGWATKPEPKKNTAMPECDGGDYGLMTDMMDKCADTMAAAIQEDVDRASAQEIMEMEELGAAEWEDELQAERARKLSRGKAWSSGAKSEAEVSSPKRVATAEAQLGVKAEPNTAEAQLGVKAEANTAEAQLGVKAEANSAEAQLWVKAEENSTTACSSSAWSWHRRSLIRVS